MTTWFTSDTHFYHPNIILYCDRPYLAEGDERERGKISSRSVRMMNEDLVKKWNSLVQPSDTVWHLGDFVVGRHTPLELKELLYSLNGEIHLVYGNHDRKDVRRHKRFASKHEATMLKFGEYNVHLCHYRKYEHLASTNFRLHGHSHGKNWDKHNIIDVGVDCWGYYPITFDMILELKR